MAEIFLFRGFDKSEIEDGKIRLASQGEDLTNMKFVPATPGMLDENVEELLNRIEDGSSETGGDAAGEKTVIMAVSSQEKALKVMRAFKGILNEPGSAAFAMITPTSLTWTLGYYMDHVSKEHEYMKTHNPADDPEMKKIK